MVRVVKAAPNGWPNGDPTFDARARSDGAETRNRERDGGGSQPTFIKVKDPTPADRLSESVKNAIFALVVGGALFVALGDYHHRDRGAVTSQFRGRPNRPAVPAAGKGTAGAAGAAGTTFLGAGSMWNVKPDAMGKLCAPVAQLLTENERSGLPPLKGIAIGYAHSPGINGLGDRIRALAGAAMVAMALGRPFRMYLKADVWNVTE